MQLGAARSECRTFGFVSLANRVYKQGYRVVSVRGKQRRFRGHAVRRAPPRRCHEYPKLQSQIGKFFLAPTIKRRRVVRELDDAARGMWLVQQLVRPTIAAAATAAASTKMETPPCYAGYHGDTQHNRRRLCVATPTLNIAVARVIAGTGTAAALELATHELNKTVGAMLEVPPHVATPGSWGAAWCADTTCRECCGRDVCDACYD